MARMIGQINHSHGIKSLLGSLCLDLTKSDATMITRQSVVKAFRNISMFLHPDKTGKNDVAQKAFCIALDAKTVLMEYSDDEFQRVVQAEIAKAQRAATITTNASTMTHTPAQFMQWLNARNARASTTTTTTTTTTSPLSGWGSHRPYHQPAQYVPDSSATRTGNGITTFASTTTTTTTTAPASSPTSIPFSYLKTMYAGVPRPPSSFVPGKCTRPTMVIGKERPRPVKRLIKKKQRPTPPPPPPPIPHNQTTIPMTMPSNKISTPTWV
jgi:hypothetical protein